MVIEAIDLVLRHLMGRDGYLDQSCTEDLGQTFGEYQPVSPLCVSICNSVNRPMTTTQI